MMKITGEMKAQLDAWFMALEAVAIESEHAYGAEMDEDYDRDVAADVVIETMMNLCDWDMTSCALIEALAAEHGYIKACPNRLTPNRLTPTCSPLSLRPGAARKHGEETIIQHEKNNH